MAKLSTGGVPNTTLRTWRVGTEGEQSILASNTGAAALGQIGNDGTGYWAHFMNWLPVNVPQTLYLMGLGQDWGRGSISDVVNTDQIYSTIWRFSGDWSDRATATFELVNTVDLLAERPGNGTEQVEVSSAYFGASGVPITIASGYTYLYGWSFRRMEAGANQHGMWIRCMHPVNSGLRLQLHWFEGAQGSSMPTTLAGADEEGSNNGSICGYLEFKTAANTLFRVGDDDSSPAFSKTGTDAVYYQVPWTTGASDTTTIKLRSLTISDPEAEKNHVLTVTGCRRQSDADQQNELGRFAYEYDQAADGSHDESKVHYGDDGGGAEDHSITMSTLAAGAVPNLDVVLGWRDTGADAAKSDCLWQDRDTAQGPAGYTNAASSRSPLCIGAAQDGRRVDDNGDPEPDEGLTVKRPAWLEIALDDADATGSIGMIEVGAGLDMYVADSQGIDDDPYGPYSLITTIQSSSTNSYPYILVGNSGARVEDVHPNMRPLEEWIKHPTAGNGDAFEFLRYGGRVIWLGPGINDFTPIAGAANPDDDHTTRAITGIISVLSKIISWTHAFDGDPPLVLDMPPVPPGALATQNQANVIIGVNAVNDAIHSLCYATGTPLARINRFAEANMGTYLESDSVHYTNTGRAAVAAEAVRQWETGLIDDYPLPLPLRVNSGTRRAR